MKKAILLILVFAFASLAVADTDNTYYVKETGERYSVLPGEEFVVEFVIASKEVNHPKVLKVYLDPCPETWTCESKEFFFDDDARDEEHPANLSVKVPKSAKPNKHTMYVTLESEAPTSPGIDSVVVSVISKTMSETLSYDEYLAKQNDDVENPAKEVLVEPSPAAVYMPDEPDESADSDGSEGTVVDVSGQVSEDVPAEDTGLVNDSRSELAENIENLESNSQFIEYATIVLVLALVFIAGAAYVSFKKD